MLNIRIADFQPVFPVNTHDNLRLEILFAAMIESTSVEEEDSSLIDKKMARLCLRAAMQALDDVDGQGDAEHEGEEAQQMDSGEDSEE